MVWPSYVVVQYIWIYGKVDKMTPVPSPSTPPPQPPPLPPDPPAPDPPPADSMTCVGQGRIDDITGKGLRTAVALSTASGCHIQVQFLQQVLCCVMLSASRLQHPDKNVQKFSRARERKNVFGTLNRTSARILKTFSAVKILQWQNL